MKCSLILTFYFFSCFGFSQVYEDIGPFHGGKLELTDYKYSFTEYFCTGNNYSKGTYHQRGDTLFFNSVDSFDRCEKYGNWFVKMVEEPFLMKGNSIYPIGKVIESYLCLKKKE